MFLYLVDYKSNIYRYSYLERNNTSMHLKWPVKWIYRIAQLIESNMVFVGTFPLVPWPLYPSDSPPPPPPISCGVCSGPSPSQILSSSCPHMHTLLSSIPILWRYWYQGFQTLSHISPLALSHTPPPYSSLYNLFQCFVLLPFPLLQSPILINQYVLIKIGMNMTDWYPLLASSCWIKCRI